MTLLPTATFLAGALLTILVPVCLVVGLVFWYLTFIREEPADTSDLGRSGVEASATPDNPGPAEGAAPATGSPPPGGQ